jgi:hypothetical protein
VVAEKVQAMVLLGIANTRMKDFYGVVYLAGHFDFDGRVLADALKATFARRETPLPNGLPLALADEFASDAVKQRQWRALLRKLRLSDGSEADLLAVVEDLRRFVARPLEAARVGTPFDYVWLAPGPWVSGTA